MKTILYFFVLPCLVLGLLCYVEFDFKTLNRHFRFYQWGIAIDSIATKILPKKEEHTPANTSSEYQKIYEKETTNNSSGNSSNEKPEEKLKWIANKTIIDNNVKAAQTHQSDGFSDVHYEDDVMQQEVVNNLMVYLNSKGVDAQNAVKDLQTKGVDGITSQQRELLLQLLREKP